MSYLFQSLRLCVFARNKIARKGRKGAKFYFQ
jgi:hypothetical protein